MSYECTFPVLDPYEGYEPEPEELEPIAARDEEWDGWEPDPEQLERWGEERERYLATAILQFFARSSMTVGEIEQEAEHLKRQGWCNVQQVASLARTAQYELRGTDRLVYEDDTYVAPGGETKAKAKERRRNRRALRRLASGDAESQLVRYWGRQNMTPSELREAKGSLLRGGFHIVTGSDDPVPQALFEISPREALLRVRSHTVTRVPSRAMPRALSTRPILARPRSGRAPRLRIGVSRRSTRRARSPGSSDDPDLPPCSRLGPAVWPAPVPLGHHCQRFRAVSERHDA
jgi:hypothetical protein